MKEVYLWTVYRAGTNSPNDTWKKEHLKTHPGASPDLIKSQKRRYTIPIFMLGRTKENQQILLFMQTSKAALSLKHFMIQSEAFAENLGADIEYIYTFNIRLGLSSELATNNQGNYLTYGDLKQNFRDNIFDMAIDAIQGTPRMRLINRILYKQFNGMDKKQWEKLIVKTQFTQEERIFKGLKDHKNNLVSYWYQ